MYCNEMASKLDEFIDGDLAAMDSQALEQHVRGCMACAALLEQRKTLRLALASLTIEGPGEDFFEQALADAVAQAEPAIDTDADDASQHRDRRPPWFNRISGALAASIIVAALVGFVVQSSSFVSSDIQEVTITMHEVTPVNLQFASQVGLKDARLSLQLPQGVDLAGFTGRKQLSWRTDLHEGNNLLQLPLLGHMASSDRLIAELEHPQGSKTFELQITVN